jgi:chemotaxis protein MotB
MSGNCPHCEEGLPEWIMSYADMITILMAFFVVMYSMAGPPKDVKKEEAVLKSLREQFGPKWPAMASVGSGAFVGKNSILAKLLTTGGSNNRNKKTGGTDVRAPLGDHPRVHTLRPGEQAVIGGILYFPESSSEITKEHLKQLQVANEEIGGKSQKIEIRGHTSRRPVPKGSPYRDNWDLAYARCRHTMEQLVALGIDPKRVRMSVAAENEPLSGRIDPLARSQNSRVEVFMLNEMMDKLHQYHESETEMPAESKHPEQSK